MCDQEFDNFMRSPDDFQYDIVMYLIQEGLHPGFKNEKITVYGKEFAILTKELVKKYIVPSGGYKFYEERSEVPFPVQRELYVAISSKPTYYELRLRDCSSLEYPPSSPFSVFNKLGSHRLLPMSKQPYTHQEQSQRHPRKRHRRKLFTQRKALFICCPKSQIVYTPTASVLFPPQRKWTTDID